MDDNKAISLQNLICAIDNNNYKFKQWILDTLSLIQENINDSISNHIENTTIHITQDDKDLWNATLQNAKDYAKKLFDSVTSFTIEIVDTLPTENIKTMTIYFMRNEHDNESDYYEEYMYINDKWEIIGSTFVNLAPYLLKEDFEKYKQEIDNKFLKYNTSDEIVNILKDYLLTSDFNDIIKDYLTTQIFNDTIKNYTTTEVLNKILEEYAKTKDIHTHENKTIIDKLSESTDGILLFNGQEIKGGSGSDITISEEANNAIQQKDDGIFVEDKTEQINNIQTQVNIVSIAQKTVNIDLDYGIFEVTDMTFNNTIPLVFSHVINGNMKLSENGYIKLHAGKTYIFHVGFYTGSYNTGYFLVDSELNVLSDAQTSSTGSYIYQASKDIEVTFISDGTNTHVISKWSCVNVHEINRQIIIDPVEHINTTQGIEDTPVGHIISHMGNTAPKHYLICDGTEYNISDYPYLAQHFKNEFGSYNYFGGDGTTTFAVPDLRGEFLRGTGENSHEYSGNGANVGEHQEPTFHASLNAHAGAWLMQSADKIYEGKAQHSADTEYSSNTAKYNKYVLYGGSAGYQYNSIYPGEYTSRPTNTSVLYCIKYEPTYYMTVGEYTVQGFEDYSEEEKVIGRWIDGRPIYRSIIITNLPSTTTNGAESYVDYSFDANIKLVTNIKATYIKDNANWTNSHNWGNVNVHYYCSLYYNLLYKFIRIYNSNVDWNNALAYIVIEYTKYTDEENSFTPDMLSTIVMSGNKQEDLAEEELNNLIADTINLLNK